MRKILALLLCCLALSLVGCGKKGGLQEPEGAEFPHKYPRK